MRSALDEIRAVKLNDRHWITGSAHILFTPFLPQRQYDALLCLADFNIVRGEDSLVRAIMAGRPFIWHAYIQDKGYQIVKVEAFLKKMRVYFKDEEVFRKYYELMIEFNRPASEKASQEMTGNENFLIFFDDLEKIKHACTGMSYFMKRKCNLIDNFIQFIDLYTNSRMKQQT